MSSYLQKTCRKDCHCQDLSFPGHLQFPEGWHREKQDHEIGYHVENSRGLKRSIGIEATAGRHQRVPDFLPWSTHSDFEDCINKVKQRDTPNTCLNPNKHEHVAFPIRDENSQILEENGQLDEGDGRPIEDC